MKVDYLYDYRNRLVGTRTYSAGTLTASTDIAIDALDRPVSQTSGGATTTFAYTGTSNRVATETKGSAVKSYGYGAYGERLTITDGANRYSYLYNQHGDVSLLVDQANTVKQAYGYTAYGGVDTTITKSAASFTDPNPYRYSAKRWDSATGTYDMGARRYNPATTRWVQQDMYYGSVENLGLSQDPLTANRYQFTGGNPVNYIEIDGHFHADIGASGDYVDGCPPEAVLGCYIANQSPQDLDGASVNEQKEWWLSHPDWYLSYLNAACGKDRSRCLAPWERMERFGTIALPTKGTQGIVNFVANVVPGLLPLACKAVPHPYVKGACMVITTNVPLIVAGAKCAKKIDKSTCLQLARAAIVHECQIVLAAGRSGAKIPPDLQRLCDWLTFDIGRK